MRCCMLFEMNLKMELNCNKNRLDYSFFNVTCNKLAVNLLGKVLVRRCDDNSVLKARVVETESYLGGEDRASHSFNGRRTPSNEPMFMKAGTAYVYMTYGMYFCFNISSREPGAAVLLRALDPMVGIEKMQELRANSRKSKSQTVTKINIKDLCNGPSKLCMAFFITKEQFNKTNLCTSDQLWFENDSDFKEKVNIIKTSRIGIDSAGEEWAKKPLRFYILGNKSVSRRDKKAEST